MNKSVDIRPINTIQIVMENAHYGDTMTVYEDGDRQVFVNRELPKRYLYPTTPGHRAAVKVPKGKKIMIFDEEERKAIALGPEEVYDFLNECGGPFDEISCTPEQQKQIIEYFRSMGCKIDENGVRRDPVKS